MGFELLDGLLWLGNLYIKGYRAVNRADGNIVCVPFLTFWHRSFTFKF
jgi:hypothetical protein